MIYIKQLLLALGLYAGSDAPVCDLNQTGNPVCEQSQIFRDPCSDRCHDHLMEEALVASVLLSTGLSIWAFKQGNEAEARELGKIIDDCKERYKIGGSRR
jgi:hypothetical protein